MLKLYNTLTRKKEKFVPIKKGKIGMYVCGPTLNGIPHLGHAMSQISFDVIRRYLIFSGYDVKFVSNITDIDDKIIQGANRGKTTIEKFSEKNEKSHKEEYRKLGIMNPDVQPKATKYVNEMVVLIKKLEEKGYTYLIDGDGVYYDISKFKEYGKLSKQTIENLESGKRVAVSEDKRNSGDFVLWKFAKDGEPFWESPWGKGRPGWHIECSAMSEKILGLPFDIHGGGADLIFPHHEDEIAQSEAGYGKKMVNYWTHNGMVTVDGKKMGKSLGNFKNIEDLKFPSMAIRYFIVSNHYRKPLDFSETALENAQNSYERLKRLVSNLEDDGEINGKYIEEFKVEMDNDFNTPKAMAILWKLVRDENAKGKVKAIKKMDEVFGLNLLEKTAVEIPKGILDLAKEREVARKNKEWEKSDELRDELKEKGWAVKDKKNGFELEKR